MKNTTILLTTLFDLKSNEINSAYFLPYRCKKSHLRTHNTHFKFSDITRISSLCLQSLRLKLRYSPFNKYFGNSLFSFTWCGPPSSSASSSLFRKGTSLDKTKGFQGKLNEFLKVFNRMIRVAF